MNKDSKILVTGATGLVGSSIIRKLNEEGYTKVFVAEHQDFDLRYTSDARNMMLHYMPEYVFHCAAKVGGIVANSSYPAEFIYDNIMINCNVINAASIYEVKKRLNLGSSCIYPKDCKIPIKEEYLLSGNLEETNRPYAISKIAAIEMCNSYNKQYGKNFMSVMPCNLYGPNDNFDLNTSHVLPALIRKFHEAKINNSKEVVVWGTGKPKREFLYADDLADACVFLMENFDAKDIEPFINIGSGIEYSIKDVAVHVAEAVGVKCEITFDTSKPDGVKSKLIDSSKIRALGWKGGLPLDVGLSKTYDWYKERYCRSR